METIKFSYNWNNKLTNKAFTTLRLHNKGKYKQGENYEIELQGKALGVATVVDIRVIKVSQLNDFVTYLDTGYNKEKTKELLKTMYKARDIDWETQELDFVLLVFKKEEKKEENTLFRD